eukprot:1936359-Amphidinium_carterae.2
MKTTKNVRTSRKTMSRAQKFTDSTGARSETKKQDLPMIHLMNQQWLRFRRGDSKLRHLVRNSGVLDLAHIEPDL